MSTRESILDMRDKRREEVMGAMRTAATEFLSTTRGAAMFGAGARILPTKNHGFCIVTSNDDRMHIDATEF